MSTGQAADRFVVANKSVPPWDRAPEGRTTDLAPRLGEHVALGYTTAAGLLGTKYEYIQPFIATGMLREGRVVSHHFAADRVTHACVSPLQWSRIYLEYGESPEGIELEEPDRWEIDLAERDAFGRCCVRIRPKTEGTAGDLVIATGRRAYRLRLVAHPTKITISCSWTYVDPVIHDDRGLMLGPVGQTNRFRPSKSIVPISRFVLVPLGRSLREVFDAWAETQKPGSHREFDRYKAARRRVGVKTDDPHPPSVMDALLAKLLVIGTINKHEVRQYVAMTSGEEGQALLDRLNEMATGRRRNRLTLPAGRAPEADELLDPFPFLAGLPDTWLTDPDAVRPPSERARRIVWSMGGAAAHAALFATVAPGYMIRDRLIEKTVREVASLEVLLRDAGLGLEITDARSVAGAILHLLDSPRCAHLGSTTRTEIARSLLLIIATLRRYIRFNDPTGERGLTGLRPADPADFADIRARLGRLKTEVREATKRSRKDRVFKFTGRLSEIERAADLNLEQIVLMSRKIAAARTDLGSEPYIDVAVPMTIVDRRGRLLPGTQECLCRIWHPKAFLQSLLPKANVEEARATGSKGGRPPRSSPKGARPVGPALPRGEREFISGLIAEIDRNPDATRPIVEYKATRGVLDAVSVEPDFLRCWRYGLFASPGRLRVDARRKRFGILHDLQLPGTISTPAELLTGSRDEMTVWRIAQARRRTVVYLEPHEHALRFAHFGLSSVLENFSRTTAWLQQVQDQSGWDVRGGIAGFLAHDKLSGGASIEDEMSWFPVGPKHQIERNELVAMTCARCGYPDGLLPEILHLADMRDKRPDPESWVFSYDGSVLSTSFLLRFLWLLLPGLGKLTYHDLRHLLANAAFEDGVPGWQIRLSLNHGDTQLWEYYAQVDPRREKAIEFDDVRARIVRHADARFARALA